MIRLPSSLPVLLPSRKQLKLDSVTALHAGSALFVVGEPGSGRTSFAGHILASRAQAGGTVFRLTGVQALSGVQFSALASLAAQISGTAPHVDSPAHLMASVSHFASTCKPTVMIDHAEDIDEGSTAALVQLAGSGVLGLVSVSGSVSALGRPLRRLATSAEAHLAKLEAIRMDDAVILLEELLAGRVNASTAERLLKHSGGSPLFLRELAYDALADKSLVQGRGYWTLRQQWKPRGTRIAELVATRLGEQPQDLREVVELLALTGQLPVTLATKLLSLDQLDRASDAGLVEIQAIRSSPPGTGQESAVTLDPAFSAPTIVATLGRSTLRSHSERIRAALPREDMHPHLRVSLAHHSQALDAVVAPHELLEDTLAAGNARQFGTVVVLTSIVEQPCFAHWSTAPSREHMVLARAEALHETGRARDALALLGPLVSAGSSHGRMRAAWIEFSGCSRLPEALALLPADTANGAGPEEAGECAAFSRLLLLVGNQPVDLETMRADTQNPGISADLRLRILCQLLVEDCYRGFSVRVLAEIAGIFSSDLWLASAPSARGEILHAIHAAATSGGHAVGSLQGVTAQLDWADLAVDHATFISAQACAVLESGQAAVALDLAGQVLSLVSSVDPHNLTGFAAAYGAAAASMVDDRARARELYELFHASPVTGGHALRADSERIMVVAEHYLHGRDAALALCDRLVDEARRRGRNMLLVRLLHDKWRLGLVSDTQELAEAAALVEGPLAAALRGYPAALGQDGSGVDELVEAHVATGHVLYAAELAQRAAVVAAARGDRTRHSRLLGESADLAQTLPGINTPALARTRIDKSALTEREYEVCLRAARRASNAAIAEELFLSPRTVEGHLQRAYAKLGVTDRRQLLPTA